MRDEPLNIDQRDTTHQGGNSNYIEMNQVKALFNQNQIEQNTNDNSPLTSVQLVKVKSKGALKRVKIKRLSHMASIRTLRSNLKKFNDNLNKSKSSINS